MQSHESPRACDEFVLKAAAVIRATSSNGRNGRSDSAPHDILPRKGPQAYTTFISVIEETEGQDFLVEQFRLRYPGTCTSVLQPDASNKAFYLCDAVSLDADVSARGRESGISLQSKVKNLEKENEILEEQVVALKSDQMKAITKLKQKELIEVALRLQGCDDSDVDDDEFEVCFA